MFFGRSRFFIRLKTGDEDTERVKEERGEA